MSEWFTVAEISKETNIPQQTLRRYMQTHNHLLRMKKEHKSYQLHKDCIEVFMRMRELYKNGKNQDEVDEILVGAGIPVTIEMVSESGEHVSVDTGKAFKEIMDALEEQKKFNETLVNMLQEQSKKMEEQQKYFDETLKQRDEMLMRSLTEPKESEQTLEIAQASEHEEKVEEQPKKSWFKRLFK